MNQQTHTMSAAGARRHIGRKKNRKHLAIVQVMDSRPNWSEVVDYGYGKGMS